MNTDCTGDMQLRAIKRCGCIGPNSMAATWRWMESECIGILQSVKMTDALAFGPLHSRLQRLPFHLAQSQVHFTVRNRMTDCAGDMQLCAKVWMGGRCGKGRRLALMESGISFGLFLYAHRQEGRRRKLSRHQGKRTATLSLGWDLLCKLHSV